MSKKSNPKPPPAIDPVAVGAAQTASNLATAKQSQELNMVNTYTPDGSVTYARDPNSPGGYSQTVSMSPGMEGIYNLGMSTLNSQGQRVSDALSRTVAAPTLQSSVGPADFSADRERVTDTIYNRAKSRLDPQWTTLEDRERTRLANQGFSENSTGYKSTMDDFGRQRNDAYEGALSDAILAGSAEQDRLFNAEMAKANFGNNAAQQNFQNEMYAQNLPIDQYNSLMGGTQSIQLPGGYNPGVGVTPTDVAGIYGLAQSGANSNYQARLQAASANRGGLYGLGSSLIGSWKDIFG